MRLKNSNPLKQPILHYATLIGVAVLGLLLRFWQLDAKPLWLDEVITALFTTGNSYTHIPLGVFFPLSHLDQFFAFQTGATCSQIAQTVATESVHPPLFFCLLYGWMGWMNQWTENWVWVMRALPALMGTGAIVALYWLNRLAFSPAAGLMGAALMAVSPFAVYLSQEARHYTLPMLLITLALVGLVQMQQDLVSANRLRPWIWLGWTAVNVIGLYTHYFCVLALIAQVFALLGWILWQKQKLSLYQWGAIGFALGGVALSYLPWLPTLMNHFTRPETDWLIPYRPDWQDRIAPLYQTVVNWVLMVIALPVEDQPDSVVIGLGLVGLVFAIWLAWQVVCRFKQLWHSIPNRIPIILLGGFTLCVILQFFSIVYILDKDITVVPRYSFVYYPGVCALLGACLVQETSSKESQNRDQSTIQIQPSDLKISTKTLRQKNPSSFPTFSLPLPTSLTRTQTIVLLASLVSSILVVQGFVFHKSYYPDRVAKDMAFEPDRSLSVVVSYESLQEVALGLSFALELQKLYPEQSVDASVQYAFLDRSSGYSTVWKTLPDLAQPLPMPLNLWIVASPGMRTKDYPERLKLSDPATPNRKATCHIDPEQFDRIGFPYQLFRCESRKR